MFKGKISIIGATGNVGRNVLQMVLYSGVFDLSNIRVSGSKKSASTELSIDEHKFFVHDTSDIVFEKNEICVFNTEADVSSHYIPQAIAAGAYVVDSSSHYRMSPDVLLIVPPVNIKTIDVKKFKLFSHANCIVSPIATVLAPIHKELGVKKVIASTYQSTSGAGKKAMDECFNETKEFCTSKTFRNDSESFPRPIPFNIIPQIGLFDDNGFSGEEIKISNEIKKIVDNNIIVTATCVRVPVLIGHATSLSIKLQSDCTFLNIMNILNSSDNIKISNNGYHTPTEVVGSDNVFVGRIRMDKDDRWLHIWICSDNLRVGAATDSFKILNAIANQI